MCDKRRDKRKMQGGDIRPTLTNGTKEQGEGRECEAEARKSKGGVEPF